MGDVIGSDPRHHRERAGVSAKPPGVLGLRYSPPLPSQVSRCLHVRLACPAGCMVSHFVLFFHGLLSRRAQHGGSGCEEQHARRSSASLSGGFVWPAVACNRRLRVPKRGPISRGGWGVLGFLITALYIWRRHVFLSFHFLSGRTARG